MVKEDSLPTTLMQNDSSGFNNNDEDSSLIDKVPAENFEEYFSEDAFYGLDVIDAPSESDDDHFNYLPVSNRQDISTEHLQQSSAPKI